MPCLSAQHINHRPYRHTTLPVPIKYLFSYNKSSLKIEIPRNTFLKFSKLIKSFIKDLIFVYSSLTSLLLPLNILFTPSLKIY